MIGIVMAGGAGSRMKSSGEKLLLKYKKPLILHVANALRDSSCFSKIIFVTSPNSPKTKNLLLENNYEIMDSLGKGYVEDLNFILQSLNDFVFITSADLPLLDGEIIKQMIDGFDPSKTCTTFLVTKKFLDFLGISNDYKVIFQNQTCIYTGISIINSEKISNLEKVEEDFIILDDKRIGFNINTTKDYELLSTT